MRSRGVEVNEGPRCGAALIAGAVVGTTAAIGVAIGFGRLGVAAIGVAAIGVAFAWFVLAIVVKLERHPRSD